MMNPEQDVFVSVMKYECCIQLFFLPGLYSKITIETELERFLCKTIDLYNEDRKCVQTTGLHLHALFSTKYYIISYILMYIVGPCVLA